MNKDIDFVLIWVDGNDPKWRDEKNRYIPNKNSDDREIRYRDWDLLRYWFRGVEKYAPWVHKVHFVTWGHLPEWLDTTNPKLNIINHKEYIPEKYLPTFSSHTIELNIHRIKELSEKFVYFNDDVFLINNVKPNDFFINNKPLDTCSLNVHCPKKSMIIQNICFNDTAIINEHFDIRKSINSNFFKWFNIKNGKELLRTITLYKCPRFPGFYQPHLAQSYLKETFKKVWEEEEDILDNTCKNKFRSATDVNQWLMREWQIASGNFELRNSNFGKTFYLDREGLEIISTVEKCIRNQKCKMFSVNDGEMSTKEFEDASSRIKEAFDSILPEKSSFEK